MHHSRTLLNSFKQHKNVLLQESSSSNTIIKRINANIFSPFVLNTRIHDIPIRTFARRSVSTVTKAQTPPSPSFTINFRDFLLGTTGIVFSALFIEYYFDSRAAFHKYILEPIIRATTDAEQAHRLAIWASKWGLNAKDRIPDDESLSVKVWGKRFSNPIGIAAGFDKNGEAIDSLFDMGFGYVEIGTVTPEPQPGNEKPRVFRLKADRALINRYGFNSDGHHKVSLRLRERVRKYLYRSAKLHPAETASLLASSADGFASLSDALEINRSLRPNKLLGINLGKNKDSPPDSTKDFVKGIRALGNFADVLVVNVSSPNTPGLRGMQRRKILQKLLNRAIRARNSLQAPRPPLLVKISPDLSDTELQDIAYVAMRSGVDGIIVSNTTTSRPEILESEITETGGLSGPPLKPLALNALRQLYRYTQGTLILVGCGGITDAQDALDYARAGASLVQLYTSFGYDGVGKAREIKDGILRELNGRRWDEVIGEEWRRKREI